MDISLSTLLLAIPIGYAFLWITVPLSTLFHELGHVLTAFFWSNDKIYVKIGMKENGRLFRVGRLQFNISLSTNYFGSCTYKGDGVFRMQKIIIALSGPIVSLLLAIAFYIGLTKVPEMLWPKFFLMVATYVNAKIFITTLFPRKRKMGKLPNQVWKSDGYMALSWWNEKSD